MRLKEARIKKGFKQKDIADLLNISQAQVSRAEKGLSTLDSNQIVLICKKLDITSDYLLGLIDDDDFNAYKDFTKEEVKQIKKTLQTSADYLKNLIEKE